MCIEKFGEHIFGLREPFTKGFHVVAWSINETYKYDSHKRGNKWWLLVLQNMSWLGMTGYDWQIGETLTGDYFNIPISVIQF